MKHQIHEVISSDDDIKRLLGNLFTFETNEYSDPILWVNGVGVTLIYNHDIEFSSMYKIGIRDSQLKNSNPRKQLDVSASYGLATLEGLRHLESNKLTDPIDFDNSSEFTIDIQQKLLYRKDSVVSPKELMQIVRDCHEKPSKTLEGFHVRLQLLLYRRLIPFSILKIDFFLRFLLWFISGMKVKNTDLIKRLMDDVRTERKNTASVTDDIIQTGETMEFFGYKAKRWSVVFFCSIHLLFAILYIICGINIALIETLLSNAFTALCYAVVLFSLTESLIPNVLLKLVKELPQLYGKIVFSSINIRM